MQIIGTSYTQKAQTTAYNGNILPSSGETESTKEKSVEHELAKSIDPSNMSRNDARTIGDALHESGDSKLASSFYVQSMILVRENGNLRNATESDAIMNENFNMFDSLKEQIEFNKSHNLPTESLENVERYLQKIDIAKVTPRIDTYT